MGTLLPMPTDSALTRLYSGDFVATRNGIMKLASRDARNTSAHIYRIFDANGFTGTEISISKLADTLKVSAECANEMMQMDAKAYGNAYDALWISEDDDEDDDEDTEDEGED
jgi:hypothetical protein